MHAMACLLSVVSAMAHDSQSVTDSLAIADTVALPTAFQRPPMQELTLTNPIDSMCRAKTQRHPWKAAAEVIGINLAVHCFDRFVLKEDFAKVYLHHMRDNLRHGFVWDNDKFSTNLFAHPYHGSLYFTSARVNGMNFFASIPYALGGSLIWEEFAETEPPALNDLIATTVGGICLGEITHRVSDLILHSGERGFRRLLRETVAALVCPMKGLNRIISGEAWHVDTQRYLHHNFNEIPVKLWITAGSRYLADDASFFRGEYNPYISILLEYGSSLNNRHNQPYDYFTAATTFGLSKNQPFINAVHLMGRIWGAPPIETPDMNVMFGIYQHFNYYDSEPVKDGSKQTPYRISEAASFGPGVIYEFTNLGNLRKLEQRIFINGILLGGTKSDYYNIISRDYNMGSGYSVKSFTILAFNKAATFLFKTDYYRIFTWKGYENKDLATVDPLYLNSQGDKGNAELLVISPVMTLQVGKGLNAELGASYFIRNTRYAFHDTVRTRTFELRLGLNCTF